MKHNKKAQLQVPGAAVDFYSYIAYLMIILIFVTLFSIKGGSILAGETTPTDEAVSKADATTILLNYLRTPMIVDESEATTVDLITIYCNQKKPDELDKIILQSKAQEILSPTTITAKLVCSENQGIMLRKPLCDSPSTINIPSFLGNSNELQYCPSIEEAEHILLSKKITSPDGKQWLKRGIYYQEEHTENLLTVEEFNKKYILYKESEEYKQKVEKFNEDINTKSRITAPDSSVWRKLGNNWCMVVTKEGDHVSCEATILSTEKLIETKGEVSVGTRIT